MNRENSRTVIMISLIAAAAFLAFLPSLDFKFVWDDDALIVFNSRITDLRAIPSFFTKSFWNVEGDVQDISRSFYRPFVVTSFALDYAMWKLNASGYHLTNILLHVINTVMVFFIARTALKSSAFALFGALLFALHPVHAENICWISGRTDLLCAMFLLAAAIAFRLLLNGKLPVAAGLPVVVGLYACSLLSKETGIVFPALALAMTICSREPRNRRAAAGTLVSLFLVAMVYMVLRTLLLAPGLTPGIGLLSLSERAAAAFLAISRYLGLFLLLVKPDPHHADALPVSALDPGAIIAAAGLAAYGIAIMLAYRERRGELCFWLTWPAITLLPVMNIGSFGDVVYADRYLYIPSAGACLLAAGAFHSLCRIRVTRVAAVAGCCLVTAASARSLASYMPVWQDNITLFEYAAKTSPDSAYIFFNLGNGYAREQRHADACRAYARALNVMEDYADALLNMSASLHRLGKHADAITLLRDMISRDSNGYNRILLTARQHSLDGEHLQAQRTYLNAEWSKRAVIYRRRTGYSLMADCLRSLGDIPAAMSLYQLSLDDGPTYAAHNNLGECLLRNLSYDRALLHFKAAAGIKETTEVYNNIGLALIKQGNPAAARIALTRAEALQTTSTELLTRAALAYNQAQAAMLLGDTATARKLLKNAARTAESGALSKDIIEDISGLLSILSVTE